jgi:hypothetical protein
MREKKSRGEARPPFPLASFRLGPFPRSTDLRTRHHHKSATKRFGNGGEGLRFWLPSAFWVHRRPVVGSRSALASVWAPPEGHCTGRRVEFKPGLLNKSPFPPSLTTFFSSKASPFWKIPACSEPARFPQTQPASCQRSPIPYLSSSHTLPVLSPSTAFPRPLTPHLDRDKQPFVVCPSLPADLRSDVQPLALLILRPIPPWDDRPFLPLRYQYSQARTVSSSCVDSLQLPR